MQRRSQRSSPSTSQPPPLSPNFIKMLPTKQDIWTALLSSPGETCQKWLANLSLFTSFLFLWHCSCHHSSHHNFIASNILVPISYDSYWSLTLSRTPVSLYAAVCKQNTKPSTCYSRLFIWYELHNNASSFPYHPASILCGATCACFFSLVPSQFNI